MRFVLGYLRDAATTYDAAEAVVKDPDAVVFWVVTVTTVLSFLL
jgi:hypothetical protein